MSEVLLAGEKIDKQTQIDIDIAIANCINKEGYRPGLRCCYELNQRMSNRQHVKEFSIKRNKI